MMRVNTILKQPPSLEIHEYLCNTLENSEFIQSRCYVREKD